MNKNVLYILTILEAIEKIRLYTQAFTDSTTFVEANDQKEWNATLNLLIAIGEDSKKLDNELRAKVSNLDWIAIVGLRNELSHNYRGVDPDIVFDIVKHHMELLKEGCLFLLNEINPNRDQLKLILNSRFYKNIHYLMSEQ